MITIGNLLISVLVFVMFYFSLVPFLVVSTLGIIGLFFFFIYNVNQYDKKALQEQARGNE